jgi:cellulose biosynthesis protein BcsQ
MAIAVAAEPVRCVLLSTGQAVADELQGFFIDPVVLGTFNIQIDYHFTGVGECLGRIKVLHPDVLLVDKRVGGLDGKIIEALRRTGQCGIVGLVPAGDTTAAVEFQSWKVETVVDAPFAREETATKILVANAIRNSTADARGSGDVRERIIEEETHYPDRVIVTHSASGGVGKSTLARELAITIGMLGRRRVALVDLCNTGPMQMKLFLDGRQQAEHATSTYPTITAALNRLGNNASDADVLRVIEQTAWNMPPLPNGPQYAKGRSHVDVFFGPYQEEDWVIQMMGWIKDLREGKPGQKPTDVYRQFIKVLRGIYPYVLIDCGQSLTIPAHEAALVESDMVLVVTTADPGQVQLVAQTIEPLRKAAMAPSKVKFCVNHYEDGVGLPPEAIKEQFGHAPLLGVVPVDRRLAIGSRMAYTPIMASTVEGKHEHKKIEECLVCGIEGLARNKLVAFPEVRKGGFLGGLFGGRK